MGAAAAAVAVPLLPLLLLMPYDLELGAVLRPAYGASENWCTVQWESILVYWAPLAVAAFSITALTPSSSKRKRQSLSQLGWYCIADRDTQLGARRRVCSSVLFAALHDTAQEQRGKERARERKLQVVSH